MKLGTAILLLTIFAFFAGRADAHLTLVRLHQPGCETGDTWEVTFNDGTRQEFVPQYHESDCVFAAVMDPEIPIETVAWVTRDGVTSVASNVKVYVPEPPWLLGVLCGVGGLSLVGRARGQAPRGVAVHMPHIGLSDEPSRARPIPLA